VSAGDVVALLILGAIVFGIVLGRRRGKQAFAAAIAQARAEGHATAIASLQAHQAVTVQVAQGEQDTLRKLFEELRARDASYRPSVDYDNTPAIDYYPAGPSPLGRTVELGHVERSASAGHRRIVARRVGAREEVVTSA